MVDYVRVTHMLLCSAAIGWSYAVLIGASFGSGSHCSPLPHGSPAVVLFDRRHPGLCCFNFTVSVNVVMVKPYVNCFFQLACVEMGINSNKLYFVLERGMSSGVGACSELAEVCVLASRISPSCSLHSSSSFANVNLFAPTGNPLYYAIRLFSEVDGVFWAY